MLEHFTTSEVEAILSSFDSEMTGNSIRDCIRLGRYTEVKTRRLLVKLNRVNVNRVNDVASILSSRKATAQPGDIRIQPDPNTHDSYRYL